MDDGTKERIAFSLALLATLFTLNPIVEEYMTIGLEILGIKVILKHGFISFAFLLGLTVYLYGFALAFSKQRPWFVRSADFVYVLSLLSLPAFILTLLAIYGGQQLGSVIPKHFDLPNRILPIIISALASTLTAYLTSRTSSKISERDKSQRLRKLSDQEEERLARARQLFEQKYFDLTVLESFKILELALKKKLVSRGAQFNPAPLKLIDEALRQELVDKETVEIIHLLRKLRNHAAHGSETITEEQASLSLRGAERAMKKIEEVVDLEKESDKDK